MEESRNDCTSFPFETLQILRNGNCMRGFNMFFM